MGVLHFLPMAATETRLLLLGAVLLFEPVNGYQVRRELLSWGVEDWGHINPGSIYSGLATLTRQGHLRRDDLREGSRTVAVYTATTEGRAEFDRLVGEALESVDLTAPLAFHTALSLLPLVTRSVYADHLRIRLKRHAEISDAALPPDLAQQLAPPHLTWMLDLWQRSAALDREWVELLLADIDSGGLTFAGEPSDWMPPPGDPGWQMQDDRQRYRNALGLGSPARPPTP